MTSGRRLATSTSAVLALVLVPAVWAGGQESVGATSPAVPAPASTAPVDGPGPGDISQLAAPSGSTDPGWPDEALLGRGRGLARFTGQRLEWYDCGGGFSCTTVQVPLDYNDLNGRTVDLAVNRLPAASLESRRGSLLVNPGGPGGSGLDYARSAAGSFGAGVLAAYDIVGFDPRGVGSSDPFVCVDSATTDESAASDPDPQGAAEIEQGLAELEEFSDACRKAEPFLLPHLSTSEVARDVDVLRAVLGDARLHWFGASYGSYIGAVYAELFPQRVGRLVLDGALDPTLDATELYRQQAAGFETALRAYVAACVAQPGCPLGADTEAGLQRIRQLLAELDDEPLPTDDPDRPLTKELGASAIMFPLYVPRLWPGLTVAIGSALDGNGRLLLNLVDLSDSRTEGEPPDESWQVQTGVNCLDRSADATVAGVKASLPSFRRASPTFGRMLAWAQRACLAWPVRPSPPPGIDGDGAAPILVAGTSRDPATPLRWAVALAGQLESGVLLTRDGDGHTAYGMGNECVDGIIDNYLVHGWAPRDGTAC